MGKSNRKKFRSDRLAKDKKRRMPDDYFRHGTFEMARFGKLIYAKNNMPKEHFENMHVELAKRFPEVCQEIDSKVGRIVDIVKFLPTTEVLKRAYWEMALLHANKESEFEFGHEEGISLRMLDYIQSIIVSVKPGEVVEEGVSEKRWQELKTCVMDLFTQLNLEFQICLTAFNRQKPDFNMDVAEYYFKAQMYWCNVRGKRYSYYNMKYYVDVLKVHENIINELYGIGIEEIIKALDNIQKALIYGIGDLVVDMRRINEIVTNKLKVMQDQGKIEDVKTLYTACEAILKDEGMAELPNSIAGRLGLDLFDLKKLTALPVSLLDDLSWEPGQDTEFFSEGEYRGWPLRIWPIWKRPFLKVDGNYYCFEMYSLFDNFYRIMERLIIKKRKEYREIWNKYQKELSEQLPLDLMSKILPNARIYKSVYYRTKTTPDGSSEWFEVDSIIIYEDHLFIFEIKAGAFTYTSPATDFMAYIESLKNLVFNPAKQGNRFKKYINSSDTVSLYDSKHQEICAISAKDFAHVTICAVTLDPFTELASQVQHLKKIGVDVGEEPVLAISIDDLRVYADVFENQLVFLHYIEERMRAFRSNMIEVDDELDHLGLYIKHNIYTQYVKNLDPNGRIRWNGYRVEIDRFYTEKLRDPECKCLIKQKMPSRFLEIIERLAQSNKPNRRKISSTLLDLDGQNRNDISSGIDDNLIRQSKLFRARPLSIHGLNRITMFCWQLGIVERNYGMALRHTRAVMAINNEKERFLVELIYDSKGILKDVLYEAVKFEDIPESICSEIMHEAENIRKRRIAEARSQRGKIGPNADCPCGSGKKYKKCCMRRV